MTGPWLLKLVIFGGTFSSTNRLFGEKSFPVGREFIYIKPNLLYISLNAHYVNKVIKEKSKV